MDSLLFPSPALITSRTSRLVAGSDSRLRSRRVSIASPSHWMSIKAGKSESGKIGRANVYDQRLEESVIEEDDLPLRYSPGKAYPLGASQVEGGINFAIFSRHASSVTLCLSRMDDGDSGMVEVALDCQKNRTGDTWHICIEGLPDVAVLYGYRIDGPHGWEHGHRFDNSVILLDPYATLVSGRKHFGDANHKKSKFLGTYDFGTLPFDWGPDYKPPSIPETDLVIYEMNVRAFTMDESSGLDSSIRGSYLGLIDKIPHLLNLGINAVELLPVFEYDEFEFQRRRNPRDHMINTWGYSTLNFFAPMSRYASAGGGPLVASLEFKQMVKALHDAGIEVILDVVYNHTNEADDKHPYTTSFRGIDNKVYYMLDGDSKLLNFSGCGNTLNCNHPVVMDLVLDSLRHWVNEYHIDGFRFDLASVLCRGTDGASLSAPPLVKAIAKDSVLSRCKIIAEPWDCGGLYLVGRFPNWDRWAEWNGQYRDDIRRFIKGDSGMKGTFATRVSGSADLYQVNKRKPCHGVNFIIAHDGFTLYDLVSYNLKHNEANGEDGKDGCNDNFSWNCGFEGNRMAGSGTTQQSIRKALGAIKDSTTVGLAKVNSDYKELDVAIVKATNHVEQLAKEKHLRAIFHAVSASRPRADVAYCLNALARRLAKTHNWAVALKTLIIIHRALREVDPTFREELINYSRSRGHMLNLSHFKDDSSPNAWDYSAWVRMYALYLEERLECLRILKYDVETERSRTPELDTIDLLEQLPALQQLLFRLFSCKPEGAAKYNNVIQYALSIVSGESIKIYNAINGGTLNLVDKFFEMQQRHDALRALEIYRKAGYQAEKLSEFYEICKGLDIGRGQNFVKIEQPPISFISAMEEYVKDAPAQRNMVDGEKRVSAPKSILAIEDKKADKVDEIAESPEPNVIPDAPELTAPQTAEVPVQAPVTDLLGFDDFSQEATQMEQKNAMALAIVTNDGPSGNTANAFDLTAGSAGWELALVGAQSSNESALADSKLAGGLDKLTLDSLYDAAIARSTPTGNYHLGQVAPNPFEAAQYSQDPFFASHTIAAPANVQMAAMAQQQVMMQGRQDSSNPFGNPFGATSQNPYTGFM